MKLLQWGKDGGPESSVFGFWLVEIKWLFSIVLLRFDADTREAYHSHAFNALTWWLSGAVQERHRDGRIQQWRPSLIPKYTPRSCFHKVQPLRRTWALSIRGPWASTWQEYRRDRCEFTTFQNGRRIVSIDKDEAAERQRAQQDRFRELFGAATAAIDEPKPKFCCWPSAPADALYPENGRAEL